MRRLAEFYRIAVAIGAIGFILLGLLAIPELEYSWSRNEGFILIGVSVAGLLLLGPSAILLAIMDDVRAIREGETAREIGDK